MKIILFSMGIMLLALGVRAQQSDTALLFVHYKFSHVRDTTNRLNLYMEDMVLGIGKRAAVYRSYERQLQNAEVKKQISEQRDAGAGVMRVNVHITGSGSEYYQFPNEKQLVRKEVMFSNFLVSGPMPAINWKISGDTATFGGLHCQKATGHFKGRDYIAWFCPDLPLHVGPWELNGLPGVIVEAYDVKRDVQFLFNGVEKAAPVAAAVRPSDEKGGLRPLPGMEDLDKDPGLIQLPADGIKTTDKEFTKLQDACRKDPNGFAQSMMAARNGGMAGDNGPKVKMDVKGGAEPVINNPIELPENQ